MHIAVYIICASVCLFQGLSEYSFHYLHTQKDKSSSLLFSFCFLCSYCEQVGNNLKTYLLHFFLQLLNNSTKQISILVSVFVISRYNIMVACQYVCSLSISSDKSASQPCFSTRTTTRKRCSIFQDIVYCMEYAKNTSVSLLGVFGTIPPSLLILH